MVLLTQSRDSSHLVSQGRYPPHRSVSIPAVTWRPSSPILASDVSFEHETSIAPNAETNWFTRTRLRALCPACDMIPGLLSVAMPEAGDFMESLEPYSMPSYVPISTARKPALLFDTWEIPLSAERIRCVSLDPVDKTGPLSPTSTQYALITVPVVSSEAKGVLL
jgi:hypothetical protein